MRIKDGFILREVGGQNLVVAVGSASKDFDGLVRLNETGTLLWKRLMKGAEADELAAALTKEYDVSEAAAREDVKRFVKKLSAEGMLER